MFAIAFDLVVVETAHHHPKGVSQAYADIGQTLGQFGFSRVQGSLYTNASEDLANLFAAISALKALPWLPACVRDIRAFSGRAMVGLHGARKRPTQSLTVFGNLGRIVDRTLPVLHV